MAQFHLYTVRTIIMCKDIYNIFHEQKSLKKIIYIRFYFY